MPNLTENNDEIERDSKRLADALVRLGLDVDDPVELQKDFAFLRSQREFYSTATRHGFMVILGLAISGVGAAIWSLIPWGHK